MKLTDEEINNIVREASKGSALNRDGGTSQRIARAIEAAVLEGVKKRTMGVIAGTSANYEELRAVIDGGSESMTHDDAVKTVKVWADAYAAQQYPMAKVDEMDQAVAAGDGVLLNEQAMLLRECRFAIDDLLKKKPMMAGLLCGYTTLGNLRAYLYDYRPQGVFGVKK